MASVLGSVLFDAVMKDFAERFTVLPAKYDEVKHKLLVNAEKLEIKRRMEKSEAEFGLVFHALYGWRALVGGDGIAEYHVVSRTFLVDKNGEVVWEFESNANITPKPFSRGMNEVKELGEVAVLGNPTDQSIVNHFSVFFDKYPEYLIQLIDNDLAGRAHQPLYKTEDYDELTHNIFLHQTSSILDELRSH